MGWVSSVCMLLSCTQTLAVTSKGSQYVIAHTLFKAMQVVSMQFTTCGVRIFLFVHYVGNMLELLDASVIQACHVYYTLSYTTDISLQRTHTSGEVYTGLNCLGTCNYFSGTISFM